MNSEEIRKLYPQRHYDYAIQGGYFITICTQDKNYLFGRAVDNEMILNQLGEAVTSTWKEIPLHYPEANNEIFIVMPNHVHGIIVTRNAGWAGSKPAPTKVHPLSEIVRAFKTYSSRKINQIRNSKGKPVWQRNYYEHVIRSESDLYKIGEYILYNPASWEPDRENLDKKSINPPLISDTSNVWK